MEFLMERRLLYLFLASWEFALLQSPRAIQTIRVKPKRKRIRKCREARRKVRKIKFLLYSDIKVVIVVKLVQSRYSGQIGSKSL